MKKILRVLTFISCLAMAFQVGATSKRIDDSHALHQVLNAFEEARFDLDGYYEVSQKVQYVGDDRVCDIVASETIVNHFKMAVKHYRAYFPDEALPFAKALVDLQDFVGIGAEYEQCVEASSDDYEELEVTHYLSLGTGINLRFQFSREL